MRPFCDYGHAHIPNTLMKLYRSDGRMVPSYHLSAEISCLFFTVATMRTTELQAGGIMWRYLLDNLVEHRSRSPNTR